MPDSPDELTTPPEAKLGASDAEDLDVPEADAEAVEGGNIGSQSSGAGAGKITFNPF